MQIIFDTQIKPFQLLGYLLQDQEVQRVRESRKDLSHPEEIGKTPW